MRGPTRWTWPIPKSLKRAKAERASDKARDKFGDDAVMTGRGARIQKAREKN